MREPLGAHSASQPPEFSVTFGRTARLKAAEGVCKRKVPVRENPKPCLGLVSLSAASFLKV